MRVSKKGVQRIYETEAVTSGIARNLMINKICPTPIGNSMFECVKYPSVLSSDSLDLFLVLDSSRRCDSALYSKYRITWC